MASPTQRASNVWEINNSDDILQVQGQGGTVLAGISSSGAGFGALASSGGVSSVFTRTGAITAQSGDYTVSQVTGAAPLASPTFTGTPAAPTATPGTNTTQIATTAFVTAAVSGGSTAFSALTSGTNTTAAMTLGTGSSFTNAIAGAASTSAMTFTGTPFAGTGTTSFPLLYLNGGAAVSSFTTFGTYIGINMASGFFGYPIDIHKNGGNSLFTVDAGGNVYSQATVFGATGFGNGPLQHVFVSGTAPTIASGFGTSPSIPASNGTAAFTVNVGTGGSTSSGVITMPAAPTGWSCHVTPNGAPQAAAVTYSAPTSATSITLTNYTQSTGATLNWTSGTVLQVICMGY